MSTVTFNGYDLSKLIKIHWDIDPEILPAVDDRTTTVGDRNGSLFLRRRIGERVISMDYTMLNADEAKRKELTRVLNVSEPKQLILGKQPDRYYMAMPKGDISRGTKGWNDWSTIDWIVYEPYAHALTPTTATNENSDGTFADTIELTNNGTVPTPLHVTAEMLSDNGFLGLTLDDNQPYQVGNPDEIDGVMYDPSQMLVPDMPALADYAINDAKYQVIPPSQGVMKQQGSLQQTSDKHISAKDFGPTPSVKGPRGPAMIYTLPADNEGKKGAKNWTFRVHDGFSSLRNKPRDVGQICATVLDINGKSIASIIMADLSQTGNEFLLRFDVNQKQVRLQRMTWKDWDGSGFTTHYYIRKSGNQFTFGWAHDPKSYTYMCDELTDTEAYYVSFSFLKWMDVPTPAYYGLINWNFRKDMVDAFKDLPNYFVLGDVVELDSQTNTLMINDYPDWDRVDIGSEPLLLPPGESTLGIVYSTFAKAPKVTVEFEERWL